MVHSFRMDSMVRGYHVYNNILDAGSDIGEEFFCNREPGNREDTHAVAITKEDVTIFFDSFISSCNQSRWHLKGQTT